MERAANAIADYTGSSLCPYLYRRKLSMSGWHYYLALGKWNEFNKVEER